MLVLERNEVREVENAVGDKVEPDNAVEELEEIVKYPCELVHERSPPETHMDVLLRSVFTVVFLLFPDEEPCKEKGVAPNANNHQTFRKNPAQRKSDRLATFLELSLNVRITYVHMPS